MHRGSKLSSLSEPPAPTGIMWWDSTAVVNRPAFWHSAQRGFRARNSLLIFRQRVSYAWHWRVCYIACDAPGSSVFRLPLTRRTPNVHIGEGIYMASTPTSIPPVDKFISRFNAVAISSYERLCISVILRGFSQCGQTFSILLSTNSSRRA